MFYSIKDGSVSRRDAGFDGRWESQGVVGHLVKMLWRLMLQKKNAWHLRDYCEETMWIWVTDNASWIMKNAQCGAMKNESGIINANNAQCMTNDAECTMNNGERCITNPLSPFGTLIRFDRWEFRVPLIGCDGLHETATGQLLRVAAVDAWDTARLSSSQKALPCWCPSRLVLDRRLTWGWTHFWEISFSC